MIVLRNDADAEYIAAVESYGALLERTALTDFAGYAFLREPHRIYADLPLVSAPTHNAIIRLVGRFMPDRVNRLRPRVATPVSVFTLDHRLVATYPSVRACQREQPLNGWHATMSAVAWGGYPYGGRIYLFGRPNGT
ncbi:hypothetical protein [Lacipirellula sp.]|uniref:hypothetical protein n=1 Tax=Lacipirellula sp. TaxID=2691419 RepID=UPI003D1432E9